MSLQQPLLSAGEKNKDGGAVKAAAKVAKVVEKNTETVGKRSKLNARLGADSKLNMTYSQQLQFLNGIGVLKEPGDETRVSLTVDAAQKLIGNNYKVFVEQGAGNEAAQPDEAYEKANCKVCSREEVLQNSSIVLQIRPPADFSEMSGKILISFVGRRTPDGKALVERAQAANVTLIDVTMVPRITIAQKLDVLSSQGKVAGHRAVVEAANFFGRFHQSEMTAAGKNPPAETFILGIGVAGLAAIGTSRALGSVVRAWDVRSEAKGQVESMGAKWVAVNYEEEGAGDGGYAKKSSQEFQKAQHAAFRQQLATVDIAITTAAIPGQKAPLLITEDMVQLMKPGSVIVDLAAATGGNCACTEEGKVVKKHGVTIVGYTDLPSRMAPQSSAMYGQNMVNLVQHVQQKQKGGFVDSLFGELEKHMDNGEEGEIVSCSIVCCRNGKNNTPPNPPKVGPGASKKTGIYYVQKRLLEPFEKVKGEAEQVKGEEELNVTEEEILKLAAPGANSELMVPVDMKGIGQDFVDVQQMLDKLKTKGTIAAFIKARRHFQEANPSKAVETSEDARPVEMLAGEWKRLIANRGKGKPFPHDLWLPKPGPTPVSDGFWVAVTILFCSLLVLGMGYSGQMSVLRAFLLAGAAGYQAVWGVAHALHTPLMAVTNAISGLTVIGGLAIFVDMQDYGGSDGGLARSLAGMSAAVSTINIFGGFIVTQRMLNLFKRKDKKGGVMLQDQDYTWFVLILVVVLLWFGFKQPDHLHVVNVLCGIFCIAAIAGLATQKSANLGCKFGITGAFTALGTALIQESARASLDTWYVLVGCLGFGAVLGTYVGTSASPMKLPQTVAGFHSLVGLAAMTTSVAAFYKNPVSGASVENISACIGNFIGGITFTGSLIAFAKLDERMASKEWRLPAKNFLNLFLLSLVIGCSCCLVHEGDRQVNLGSWEGELGKLLMWGVALVSCLLGVHLVASVGGGDMPVCVTVLNSYSGWALAAEGFNLNKPLLACVGAIIGFSGAILTKIMCDAMNRDILNVLFGGMNSVAPAKADGDGVKKEHRETTCAVVADLLRQAEKIAVVPGYGMALSRAQGPAGDLAIALRDAGKECVFVIHPVAGRMPGQMNVLLAEASVPHDWVKEMDEVNDTLDQFDVSIIIGANDVVNSAAEEIEDCSIWGMPVIKVWNSKKVIFLKRSMGKGYADLDNPVFFKDNTDMLLGSAADNVPKLVTAFKDASQA